MQLMKRLTELFKGQRTNSDSQGTMLQYFNPPATASYWGKPPGAGSGDAQKVAPFPSGHLEIGKRAAA